LALLGIGAVALFALSKGKPAKDSPQGGAGSSRSINNPLQGQESPFVLNVQAPDFPTFDEAGALNVPDETLDQNEEQAANRALAPKGLFEISNVTPAKARAQASLRGYSTTGGVHLATLDTYVYGGITKYQTEELILARERERLAAARAAGTATQLDFSGGNRVVGSADLGSMSADVTAYGEDSSYRNPETPLPAPTASIREPVTDYVQDTRSTYTAPIQRTAWSAFTFF